MFQDIAVRAEAMMLLCNWSLICLTWPLHKEDNRSRGRKKKEKGFTKVHWLCLYMKLYIASYM